MGSNRLPYVVPCAAIACTLWTCLAAPSEGDVLPRKSRVPLSTDVECIPSGIDAFPADFMSQEERRNGGVLFHVFVVCYVCAMLAVVCDDHFVPALEAIVQKLNISPDVAGATFMAMGASAPELFSSIAGSFVTEDDIGLGTILGSAVFNILGISGIVGLVLWNQSLSIRRYPVLRDCVVYTCTVVVLSFVIVDNVVQWWEALLLVAVFCSYILFMHFNARVEKALEDGCCRIRRADPEKESLLEKGGGPPEGDSDDADAADEKNCCLRVWRGATWLPSLLFRLTIPPVRWYPLAFVASVVWMGGLSYVAVWMVTVIGYTLSIPDSVSGLTLLAAGSSVPDLVATVVIAKSGKGNMAISNLLGSNTFDIAFCLGVPWLVKTLLSRRGRLLVYSSAMIYTVSTLLVSLFALLLTFQLNGWKLDKISGMVCFGLYVACITLACLYELNVFGEINKPPCS